MTGSENSPDAEYPVRAAMYRLLVAFTGHPDLYRDVLDKTMHDPRLRDIVNYLVGVAFGGYVVRHNGDPQAAIEEIIGELHLAEDLDDLKDPADLEDGQ